MAKNFNVEPYYDDFDATKNFHRILFKPGVAVQARELTQSQTILQNQITSFADNIFKQNSPVSGGHVTTNLNCDYIKLKSTYNGSNFDVTDFNNLVVQNSTGSVVARVLTTVTPSSDGVDPPTLVVSYLSGGKFANNDIIYDATSNLAVQALEFGATGKSSVASIASGVFYVLGNFVKVNESTIVLSKYSNTPSVRVGLNITETIEDYANDASLLDPAIGASNYQAPGADRYVISLNLSTRPLQFGDDSNFIELVRIENGSIYKMVDGSVYSTIDDYFAKRDYETNGDYIVNDFKLVPTSNPNDPNTYLMSIGKGLAYVHGYRTENPSPINLVSDRARDIETLQNNPVYINYGNYFYVNNVSGNTSSFFNVTGLQQIDLHCVSTSNISTSSANTYNATLAGTGYIRNIEYSYDAGTTGNTANYVYKAFVYDISANTITANAVSGTSSTITFPSTFSSANDAYTGVSISITAGVNSGDVKTITSYNGSTKTATINTNWSGGVSPNANTIFKLNFASKDIESLTVPNKSSFPAYFTSKANIANIGKVGGIPSGDTVLVNPNIPELIFNVGSPYVSGLTDGSYTTTQEWRNITFTTTTGGVSAQLSYEGAYLDIIKHFGTPSSTLSDDLVKQNFIIVVTDKGSNASLNVGDIIPWTSPNRSVTLDNDGSIATLKATDLTAFSATVVAKVFVENAFNTSHILKIKNYITANANVAISNSWPTATNVNTYTWVDDSTLSSTGQVYIQYAGLMGPGVKQPLYLSDVKQVVKIIDTGSPSILPTKAMLSDVNYSVTNNFLFDNGQRDNYYDHASITLLPGAPPPKGNLLVLVNYYQHSGGDGYFCKLSYVDNATLKDEYRNLPSYKSTNGAVYNLRDCLDFRPSRTNATTSFDFRYSNPSDTTKYGTFLPVDASTYVCDYSYYLSRIDKLILTKDKSFQIKKGISSLNPVAPTEPDASLVIAIITHKPYTGYLPYEVSGNISADINVQKVQHKRYTMQDIAGLESRISNVEYYTSLSILEKNAQSLQISDSYGLNRFKNGILVDDFSGFSVADTYSIDYLASINRRLKRLSCAQYVNNFPLHDYNLVRNGGRLPDVLYTIQRYDPYRTITSPSLDYAINKDSNNTFFTLPYTVEPIASQVTASRDINVNPFNVPLVEGIGELTPNVDVWVDNTRDPSLLITNKDLKIYTQSNNLNVLQLGDWQTISSTTVRV